MDRDDKHSGGPPDREEEQLRGAHSAYGSGTSATGDRRELVELGSLSADCAA